MIRRVSLDDAYIIARMRQTMWEEMRPEESATAAFREAMFVYWYEALESGRAVGWIAEQGVTPIGMTMLLLHHHPPRPTSEARRGYVTSVYVAPEHRRRGVGRALMEAAIAYGREQGLQRLELRTSEQGRALYEAVGFRPQEVMMLRLDEGSYR